MTCVRTPPWFPLLAGALALLLLALAESFYFGPERRRLGETLEAMRNTIAEGERALPLIPGLQSRLWELERERDRFLALVPPKPPGDRFLAELRRSVAAQGAQLDRVVVSYENRGEYALARYRAELSGRFPALVGALEGFKPEGMVYWVPEVAFRSAPGKLEATVVFFVPYRASGGGQ